MSVPILNVKINFSTGPSFGAGFVLDTGILDTDVLGATTDIVVDVSNITLSVRTKRGRDAQADQFQTGTLELKLADQNGDFNPQNPSGPYYNLLTPMRKVTVSATYGATTYVIYSGYITSYTTTIPNNADGAFLAYTTITCVDAFRLAQNAQIAAVTGAVAGDLSGTRINQILNQIGWPSSMRDVDAGLTTMQADPGTARTSLAAMQTVEISEYGSLYVGANGFFTFQDRAATTGQGLPAAVVYNDNGTNIPYFNAIWRTDDTLVYNEANITRTGGTVQTASDAASIAKYFLHSYNQQNLLMETDAVALNYAQCYVASRATTSVRCDAIELDLYMYTLGDGGTEAALGLDYFDPVTISTTMPGSTVVTKTLQVFGISMDITPNKWRVTLQTLEPIIDGFILDSTLYGILDTGVLTY